MEPQNKTNYIEFNDWFSKEAKDLQRFLKLLTTLIPVGIIASILTQAFNLQATSWFGDFLKDVKPNGLLMMSILLQFVFMAYLVWRMISRMLKDNTNERWQEAPVMLGKDKTKLKRFLTALDFRSDNNDDNLESKVDALQVNIKNALRYEDYFKSAWLSVWIIFLLIYIIKGFAVFGIDHPSEGIDSVLLGNFYNLLICFHIFAFATCYFLLSITDNRNNGRTGDNGKWGLFILIFVVFTLFFTITAFSKYDDFSNTRTMTFIFLLKIIRNVLLSTFFALTINKLLSKDLGSPSWLRIALFFYIAMIPLFVIFSDMPELKARLHNTDENIRIIMCNVEVILYTISWIFKFCLFLFVAWLIENDHLLFYFLRFIGSIHDVKKDRQEVDDLLDEQ